MYIHCLPDSGCVVYLDTSKLLEVESVMNLRAAQKELGSRSPDVTLLGLGLETLFLFTLGWILVGIFA
jgi:hypothetical protein